MSSAMRNKVTLLSTLFSFGLLIGMDVTRADDLLEILSGKSTGDVAAEFVLPQSELGKAIAARIPQSTAEQNIFFAHLNAGEMEKAIYQWGPAFRNTDFLFSDTGQALYGYLLYKNGLPIFGLETLFSVKNPKEIPQELVKLWRLAAPSESAVWQRVQIQWLPIWTEVFDANTEVAALSGRDFQIVKDSEILELLKAAKLGSAERKWLEWQMLLKLAVQDDVEKAARVLALLLKESAGKNQPAVENKVGAKGVLQNTLSLTAARLLYQKGFLSPAIEHYKKIPKSSVHWFLAQEEIAWAYLRKGEPQNSLATLKGLDAKEFEHLVGPETIFVRSLASLKVCDYTSTLSLLKEFRERFQSRWKNLEVLVQRGSALPDAKILLGILEASELQHPIKPGPWAVTLPRRSTEDVSLLRLALGTRDLKVEVQKSSQMFAKSIEGGSEIGFQGDIGIIKQKMEERLQTAESAFFSRVREMALMEKTEIEQLLQKMHIIEAEVIQQISLAESIKKANSVVAKEVSVKVGTTGSEAKETLKFPFEGERWFDEISNYKITIRKGCQAKASGGGSEKAQGRVE